MVPRSLRVWFIIHFAADVVFAAPMFVAPVAFLTFFGWPTVDPLTTRAVSAALFAIGIESWLCRNASADVYRAMLNLKIIWSGAAVIGFVWGLISGAPPALWLFLVIFAGFHGVWVYYRVVVARTAAG